MSIQRAHKQTTLHGGCKKKTHEHPGSSRREKQPAKGQPRMEGECRDALFGVELASRRLNEKRQKEGARTLIN